MIQSHYVPLPKPYRIIYSGGAVGLQIGTLIVVSEATTTFHGGKIVPGYWGVNTYSYPVVSYINKDGKASDRPSLISSLPGSDDYSEAVVWDQVQQRDVATLCVEGGFLDWGILLTIIDQIFRESTD